jgi:hypothetical protein
MERADENQAALAHPFLSIKKDRPQAGATDGMRGLMTEELYGNETYVYTTKRNLNVMSPQTYVPSTPTHPPHMILIPAW